MFKKLKLLNQKIVNFIAAVIFILMYFTIIPVFVLMYKITMLRGNNSSWREYYTSNGGSMDDMKKQW
jgi:hypothetical protein